MLLVFLVSCDSGGSSRQPAKRGGDLAAPEETASGETALELKREDPVPCPSGPMSSWTMHEQSTASASVNDLPWMTPDVVVSRAGTATVAFASADDVVRTADDPPAFGDPQDPAHGKQNPHSPMGGVHIGIDASDVQTTMVQEFVRLSDNSGSSNEVVDLQLPDRVPGGEWSSSSAEVTQQELLYEAHLAVNASGAAVLMWLDSSSNLNAVYRHGAGATWTAPQRVPASADISPNFEVGIDDAGRVVVVGRYGGEHGVRAIRRSPAGKWGKAQELSGPGTDIFTMTVSAGGAAVALHGPLDLDGVASGPLFASRMSPAGHWRSPVRQWSSVGFEEAVGMDGKGRALIAGWNGADLMGRWSTPDGRWREPFVLASDVSRTRKWGLAVAVEVNRRGAAVVGWGAQGRVAQVWARYKPIGQKLWTRPVRLTRTDDPPELFRAAIGECGHVAFVWETSGDTQLHVLRASPRP
ncbi:hypothetical protein [Nocardioides astragali]|uniref:Exo-alpha-sialidase n=1 Tax=Nocardioides astragali TaxID=1776736 RepID=A0ABW2N0K2_9ACTN|nr:hypothetical protein [Nocardioides astragali]